MMNVEEFQVPDQLSPSVVSECEDFETSFGIEPSPTSGSLNDMPSSLEMDQMSNGFSVGSLNEVKETFAFQTPPASVNSLLSSVQNSNSSSPILPADFFRDSPLDDDNASNHAKDSDRESQLGEDSTDEEEEEQEPIEGRVTN
jgi:hypothetical protein